MVDWLNMNSSVFVSKVKETDIILSASPTNVMEHSVGEELRLQRIGMYTK